MRIHFEYSIVIDDYWKRVLFYKTRRSHQFEREVKWSAPEGEFVTIFVHDQKTLGL